MTPTLLLLLLLLPLVALLADGNWRDSLLYSVVIGFLQDRIERRLRDGVLFFFDGKAQAQARRSTESGNWQLPGGDSDGSGMVGVAGSTGVMR